MQAAVIAQVIKQKRRPVDELPAFLVLAVDDPQRVLLEPVPAVAAKFVQVGPEIILQLLMKPACRPDSLCC